VSGAGLLAASDKCSKQGLLQLQLSQPVPVLAVPGYYLAAAAKFSCSTHLTYNVKTCSRSSYGVLCHCDRHISVSSVC
jgi:hypothetical protein